jgi:hypothetical protein
VEQVARGGGRWGKKRHLRRKEDSGDTATAGAGGSRAECSNGGGMRPDRGSPFCAARRWSSRVSQVAPRQDLPTKSSFPRAHSRPPWLPPPAAPSPAAGEAGRQRARSPRSLPILIQHCEPDLLSESLSPIAGACTRDYCTPTHVVGQRDMHFILIFSWSLNIFYFLFLYQF